MDLKVFDIPETVRRTVSLIANEGVRFVTIHGNEKNIRAAAEARGESGLKLLAVTVLTSLDADDIKKLGLGHDIAKLAVQRARDAMEAGCDGVITSPHEAVQIKEATGGRLLIVTPGIRPDGSDVAHDDQKRFASPTRAIGSGADYLVVGRPITGAPNPQEAAREIVAEMQSAFDERG